MTTNPAGSRRPLTTEEEAYLRAFARASLVIPRVLDADLMRDEQMSLTEYFVLVHLSEAAETRLRMSELAAAGALSLSGMTRVVNRLAELGLVRRERTVEDGRGWLAVLTDAGRDRLHVAWPAHLASVRRLIFDYLSGIDLRPITAALEQTCRAADEDKPSYRGECAEARALSEFESASPSTQASVSAPGPRRDSPDAGSPRS